MFSKSKINEPGPKQGDTSASDQSHASSPAPTTGTSPAPSMNQAPKAKPPASTLSADLTIVGNIRSTGDILVEGTVQGDIRAHLLTVGEGATVEGEIVADDIVVTGRVTGKVRGLKVRLTSSAVVEGDIIHKTIAIESGAHFEGSVQRQEDPLAGGPGAPKPSAAQAASAAPKPAAPSAPTPKPAETKA
ncbi:polymer-forming cytoskeletal protein [Rhodobacterales bacterium HKCCE2091]|nr:polymer-forming cytoskeletal protein [Rhodobacterales bacterium HKCCE2091]